MQALRQGVWNCRVSFGHHTFTGSHMRRRLVVARQVVSTVTVGCAIACGSASTSSAPVLPAVEVATNQEFELAVGQSASVSSPPATVRFDTVAADSRCPIDAICVWAGDAALRFTLRVGGGAARSVELHSFSEPKLVNLAGATLELTRVTPANDSRAPIALKDYRARLVVRGER